MRHRAAALQKLAEGLDEIVASHAEKLAKGSPIESTKEHVEKYEVEADLPEGHSEEEEEAGAEAAKEAEEEESEPKVEGEIEMKEVTAGEEPEEDSEMAEVRRQLMDRLKSKPAAIRRG